MKKIIITLVSLFIFIPFIKADEQLDIYLFYSDIYNYIIHLSSEELPKEPTTPKFEDIDEINFFGDEDK